jgi:Mg-chelatase subunit ChlD
MLPTSTAYLHHNDRTIEQMLAEWKASDDQRSLFRTLAHQQRREQSSILASMIAAFRANQAAWQSRRVQVSRSGVIDTAKLAQYKLVEDLFLRRRSLPEAQNHGFVIHVDWSGSMEGKMAVVLWQTLHLIWFAESINVPVSVYGFSNSGTNTPAGDVYAEACRKAYRSPERGRLVELYRSNATAQVKQDAQSFLFALVLRFAGVPMIARWDVTSLNAVLNDPAQMAYHVGYMPKSVFPITKAILPTVREWDHDTQRNAFYHPQVSLGGTPLHYALVSSVDTVRKFRQVHRIEQCVSVWLTDGEDTDGVPVGGDATEHVPAVNDYLTHRNQLRFNRHEKGALFDARSARTFKIDEGRSLAALFSLHRALTGATVICIDITPAPLNSLSRVLSKSALSIVANNVGPQDDGYSRRRRGRVRAKAIKQTRKRVVIKSDDGTFEETGLMLVTRAQYPEIGCDAYLVTHPDWWAQRDESKEQEAHVASTSRILSSGWDEDEDVPLTPEEREAEARSRPVRLAAALREGAAHIAMRRFADLLVPYMAAGREDATV